MEIYEMTALEVAEKIRNKEITAVDAVESVAKAIDERDKTYNCYTHFNKELALEKAQKAQKLIDDGEATSPLAGVPVAVKDNICTKGDITSCSSKILYNFKPPYDATVIQKLDAAGIVPCGKVNMDEFAMGSTTETSFYGATKNPWDVTRVPGGSSGGAAAAVAADESVIALGSDTGGSIRQPCSFCGVTGLKPTYGAVSRYGLIAYASSLDQIGPIGKNALDVAAMFSVISGKDVKDGTSMDGAPFALDDIKNTTNLKGKKIGIPSDYFGEGINEEVAKSVMAAAETLKELGAEVEEFSSLNTQFQPTISLLVLRHAQTFQGLTVSNTAINLPKQEICEMFILNLVQRDSEWRLKSVLCLETSCFRAVISMLII